MKILYTVDSGKIGGMELHILDLVKGMINLGHEVHIWCQEGKVTPLYREAGAVVTTKKIKFELDPEYILSLSNYIKENRIDIVHSHMLKASSNSMLAGVLSRIPVKVTHIHTPISEWPVSSKLKKFYTHLTIKGYSFQANLMSTVEIALTESRKRVKMQEGIQEKKLVVIPNGLDTNKFKISEIESQEYREEIRNKHAIAKNAFVFGVVSRVTEEKGHEYLIRAFHKFLASELYEKDKFVLLIAGGGSLEKNLKKLCKELGIEDRVIFTGVFPHADLAKYYASIDLFVFPSIAEGFGLVLIEAMYSGLPIICSDLEVLHEVGGDTVWYFKSKDFKDLADTMVSTYSELITQDVSKPQLAKKRVEDLFSLEKFIENYTSLYKRLLEKKGL